MRHNENGREGDIIELPVSEDFGEKESETQKLTIDTNRLKQLLIERKAGSVKGRLDVFVQKANSKSLGVWHLVCTKQIEISLAPRIRVFPSVVYWDSKTEDVTLRIMLSRKRDDFGNVTVNLYQKASGRSIPVHTSVQQKFCLNVSISANELRASDGEFEFVLLSDTGIDERF